MDAPESKSSAPAGWFPDYSTGKVRWWDGAAWTAHTSPGARQLVAAITQGERPSPKAVWARVPAPLRPAVIGGALAILTVMRLFGMDTSCYQGPSFCGPDTGFWATFGIHVALLAISAILVIVGLVAWAVRLGTETTASVAAEPGTDKLARLSELARLQETGALSESEFEELKRELLT